MQAREGEAVAQEQRRLAAIVSADVVGYTKLMGQDEAATLAALRRHRKDLIDPLIGEYRGRLVKTMGDGLLLEFGSVVAAATFALAMQRGMAKRNAAEPSEPRVEYRVGINLGDIIVDGDDIFGDGVNISARLQEIAEPGGIAVSRRVQEDLINRIDVVFEDDGEHELKNVERPVHVWRWRPGAPSGSAASAVRLTLPDRPSIAVLPFANLSGDPEQDYFADGVAEDIIGALARVPWFFVTARNSSFTYKGRTIDVKRIGRELGVRFVLQGSVRRAGSKLRVAVQLSDAVDDQQIWTDRHDGTVKDVFEFQDRITEAVAGILEPTILSAEIDRVRRKRPGNLDAYDHYLQALAKVEVFTREALDAALGHCRAAIEFDPDFARALTLTTRCHLSQRVQGWLSIEDARAGLVFVERALQIDRQDAYAHSIAGHCYAFFEHDLDKGVAFCDQAIDLNPHHAWAYLHSGVVRTYACDPDTAVEHFLRAERLSPRDLRIASFYGGRAMALEIGGDPEAAFRVAKRAVQSGRNYAPAWRVLASSAAELGRLDEARAAAAALLRIDPAFTVSNYRARFPIASPQMFEPMFVALYQAGLPEQ